MQTDRPRLLMSLFAVACAATIALAACAKPGPPGSTAEQTPPASSEETSTSGATSQPATPAGGSRLVFVHHSTGQAWLEDSYGLLAADLADRGYYVSDTNYGWGPDAIGDRTDVGDWWTWFRGPNAEKYTKALFACDEALSSYERPPTSPGGENTVIMLKSCFPNSALGGLASDAPTPIDNNRLKGNGTNDLTVGNAKGIYRDLLGYFEKHPGKLFVLVTSPPLFKQDTDEGQAANARALADWMVSPNGLLKGYSGKNVLVFDYYTVLTGGHHRIVGQKVEHTAGPSNYSAFPTNDSHPTAAGDKLATREFVPLLDASYASWSAGDSAMLR